MPGPKTLELWARVREIVAAIPEGQRWQKATGEVMNALGCSERRASILASKSGALGGRGGE
jgi:hypothetical protein